MHPLVQFPSESSTAVAAALWRLATPAHTLNDLPSTTYRDLVATRRSLYPSGLGAVLCFFLSCWGTAFSQEYKNDPDAPWNRYLARQTREVSDRAHGEIERISLENWAETQVRWREQLQEMLGLKPWPDRTDLRGEVLKRTDLEEVTVETLCFEPLPLLYVTANFYLPRGERPAQGWPTVLYVCGHSRVEEFGRLLGNKTSYQHHGLWFAKHGMACLIVDTIQLGEFHGEHHGTYRLGRWDWVTRGYTPAGIETWTAIRSIDYLQSRPEVRGDKIGMTGRSGGGAYTWFAAALDDRIQAAVPVAGITDLQNHIVDGCVEGHCDCMFMVNTHQWDYSQVAAMIAPRPLLLGNTDSDSIFPLDGVLRIHRLLEGVYKRLQKPANYGLLIAPGPHKDIQELQVGAFKWLARHLKGEEILVDRAATKEIDAAQLVVFPQELPREEGAPRASKYLPTSEKRGDPAHWRTEGKAFLEGISQRETGRSSLTNEDVSLVQSGTIPGWNWSVFQVASSDDWERGWIQLSPASDATQERRKGSERAPNQVLHLADTRTWKRCELQKVTSDEIASWVRSDAIARALEAHPQRMHLIFLPRGWDLEQQVLDYRELTHLHRRFYLLGDSLEQLQLRDIFLFFDWLTADFAQRRESPGGDPRPDRYQVFGSGRNWLNGALLAWHSVWREDPRVRVTALRIEPTGGSILHGSCIPTLERDFNVAQILQELSSKMEVETEFSISERGEGELIRMAPEPQQATGVQVTHIDSRSAIVRGRATRWPLANLADLAAPRGPGPAWLLNIFAVERALPSEQPYVVPGMSARMRVRWKRIGPETHQEGWKESGWKDAGIDTDYAQEFTLTQLEPNTVYEFRVEAKANGSDKIASTQSGRLRTLPEQDDFGSFRIAFGVAPSFEEREGPFGFEAMRTMRKRKTDVFVPLDSELGEVPRHEGDLNPESARQRLQGLPTLLDFSRNIPTLSPSTAESTAASSAENQKLAGTSHRRIGSQLGLWILSPDADLERVREAVQSSDTRWKVIVLPPKSKDWGDRLDTLRALPQTFTIRSADLREHSSTVAEPRSREIVLGRIASQPANANDSNEPLPVGEDLGASTRSESRVESSGRLRRGSYLEIEVPGSGTSEVQARWIWSDGRVFREEGWKP